MDLPLPGNSARRGERCTADSALARYRDSVQIYRQPWRDPFRAYFDKLPLEVNSIRVPSPPTRRERERERKRERQEEGKTASPWFRGDLFFFFSKIATILRACAPDCVLRRESLSRFTNLRSRGEERREARKARSLSLDEISFHGHRRFFPCRKTAASSWRKTALSFLSTCHRFPSPAPFPFRADYLIKLAAVDGPPRLTCVAARLSHFLHCVSRNFRDFPRTLQVPPRIPPCASRFSLESDAFHFKVDYTFSVALDGDDDSSNMHKALLSHFRSGKFAAELGQGTTL